jgi:hypothetical protein
MDYCDIDYLEEYGYFDNVPETARAMLTVHITQASDMIDRYCGRKFGIPVGAVAETRTFTMLNGKLDPKYGATLWLDEDIYAIVTIATVAAGVTLTWLPDQPPYHSIVRDGGSWEDPTTITGFWAYSNQPPALIVNSTARLAMWLYHQRESVTAEGNTPNPPNNIPNDVLATLKNYKRVRLP